MHNTILSIGQTAQAITIKSPNISAHGGAESPLLIIPFIIAFIPVRGTSEEYIVFNISAQLYLTPGNFRVAQDQKITNFFVHRDSNPYEGAFTFPLTSEQLFYIEKHRKGDLPAFLQITVQVAVQESLHPAQKGGYCPTFIRGIELGYAQQYFTIPQSQWVNVILPKLGYHAGALVEIPGVSILLPKEYSFARQEILQAHKYFNAGDYDKTVAHCRSAMDPIHAEFLKPRPDFIPKSRFKWLKDQFVATYNFIDAIVDANYTIANKSHHPPSIGNFGRNEATAILGITTQIIAYFGSIVPEPLPDPLPNP